MTTITSTPVPAAGNAALLSPQSATAKAPDTYKVKLATTKGDIVIEVQRAWAPNGADRFYNLVKNGYYDDVRFFRVVPDFMVQFGINGTPGIQTVWSDSEKGSRSARSPRAPSPTGSAAGCR